MCINVCYVCVHGKLCGKRVSNERLSCSKQCINCVSKLHQTVRQTCGKFASNSVSNSVAMCGKVVSNSVSKLRQTVRQMCGKFVSKVRRIACQMNSK